MLEQLFGSGRDLNALQMSCRGIVIFFITLVLLRISGRRSFGVRAPVDNIIAILLGAILSRAVVGVSPFFPVVITSLVIAALHRLIAWLLIRSKKFSTIVQGDKILLFDNQKIIKENLDRALVCETDIYYAIRQSASTEDASKIEKIYMEHNGEISVIKAESPV